MIWQLYRQKKSKSSSKSSTIAVVDFGLDQAEEVDFRNSADLALAVLKVWFHFSKSNLQWPLINIIGHGLEPYRDMLVHAKV